MKAETCRRCRRPLVLSLVGVPHCPPCHREARGEIDRMVRTGVTFANQQHAKLLDLAEKIKVRSRA